MKEFLLYAIGKGWIDGNAVESGEDYVTAEEMYRMAAWSLTGKVTEDVGFMKLLFKMDGQGRGSNGEGYLPAFI